MQYRTLGRTGLKVSVLGFGAMRLPMRNDTVDREKAIPMIHRAFEAGVNYIDSAVFYCSYDSERTVGEALQGWRDKVIVSTKNHFYEHNDKKSWWTNLQNSLERLRVDYLDIYNFHGLTWEKFTESVDGPNGLYKEMLRARDQGLIRHICFSFHDSCENLIKLIDTDMFESVTCQYNLLDRSNEAGIAHARKKNVGVSIMGPVGGGRLGETGGELAGMLPPGIRSTAELALRFVLANPNVSIALSGMSTMQQVEENLGTADRGASLTADEVTAAEQVMQRLKEMADLYCTGCKYCMPCPHGVAIPTILNLVNLSRVYGATARARKSYARLVKQNKEDNQPATECVDCGQCESKCPQHIKIAEELKQAHQHLMSDG